MIDPGKQCPECKGTNISRPPKAKRLTCMDCGYVWDIRRGKTKTVGVQESNQELPAEVMEALRGGQLIFLAWLSDENHIKTLVNGNFISQDIQIRYSDEITKLLVRGIEESGTGVAIDTDDEGGQTVQ